MTAPSILSKEECERLTARVLELVRAEPAQVELLSLAYTQSQFARGDTHVAKRGAEVQARLTVGVNGRHGHVSTNQIDDAGLRILAAEAEIVADANPTVEEWALPRPAVYPEGPQIAFDANLQAMAAEAEAELISRTVDAAEAAGLIAAGDVYLEASAQSARNTEGLFVYDHATYGEFSVTATGDDRASSGWAWSGYEDWNRVEATAVIDRAVALAQRSADPVAVEPGRYAVILEPPAVAALLVPIFRWWAAYWAHQGVSAFARDPSPATKMGLQMMDRRLGMVSSPWDPERPASTIHRSTWRPIEEPVVWFEKGVLKTLAYDPFTAQRYGQKEASDPGGVRLTAEGPRTSLEDMIASTRRGIWVNRLSHVTEMDTRSLSLTGTTRDGTFLIENGAITKPIKNFRFTESPFFILNQLEAWGEPVRASRDVVAPRLMLRDFNFTSLADFV